MAQKQIMHYAKLLILLVNLIKIVKANRHYIFFNLMNNF